MIIYLNNDKECDLAIVLFADDKIREDIIITQETRKIVFLNYYPYHESSFLTFVKLKKVFENYWSKFVISTVVVIFIMK